MRSRFRRPGTLVPMAEERVRLTVVYEDAGDGWVMARIPQLPGVLTQGETVEEARAMIASALRDYLEFYVETQPGEPPAPDAHTEPLELLIREAS